MKPQLKLTESLFTASIAIGCSKQDGGQLINDVLS